MPDIYVSQALEAERASTSMAWRWAEDQKKAAPRRRNREEMIAAYEEFKVMFFNLPDQRAKDKSKKRSHLHAHMTSVARRGRRRNGRLRSTTAERGLQHQSLSR